MAHLGFAKAFKAATDVPPYRVVKAVSSEEAGLATSPSDKLLGISTDAGTSAGVTLDVILEQSAELKLGGAVELDDPITSDANGCGVLAYPDPGEKLKIVGFALSDGAVDDIIEVKVQPGFITG